MKVLLSGDINGKWNTLFKRVAAVNKSNGPFDVLLCTGRTFGDAGDVSGNPFNLPTRQPAVWSDTLHICDMRGLAGSQTSHQAHTETAGATEDGAEIDAELQPYLDGSKQPAIPTYFIGAFGRGSVTALEALQQSDAGSSGLTYLGRSGIQSVHGLNVAFLDGTYSSLEYREGLPGNGSAACRHFTQVTHWTTPCHCCMALWHLPVAFQAAQATWQIVSQREYLSLHDSCNTCIWLAWGVKGSKVTLRSAGAAGRSFPGAGKRAAVDDILCSQEDVRKLERALEEATGDIDILLTCEWPADVTAATPPGSAPAEAGMPGQPHPAPFPPRTAVFHMLSWTEHYSSSSMLLDLHAPSMPIPSQSNDLDAVCRR